jgi:hypothetical protein
MNMIRSEINTAAISYKLLSFHVSIRSYLRQRLAWCSYGPEESLRASGGSGS